MGIDYTCSYSEIKRNLSKGSMESCGKILAWMTVVCGCIMALISVMEFFRAHIIFHASANQPLLNGEHHTPLEETLFTQNGSLTPPFDIMQTHVVCLPFGSEFITAALKGIVEIPQSIGISCVCQVAYLFGSDNFDLVGYLWNYLMSVRSEDFYQISRSAIDSIVPKGPSAVVRRHLAYAFPGVSCDSLVQWHLIISYMSCLMAMVWFALGVYYAKCWVWRRRKHVIQKKTILSIA